MSDRPRRSALPTMPVFGRSKSSRTFPGHRHLAGSISCAGNGPAIRARPILDDAAGRLRRSDARPALALYDTVLDRLGRAELASTSSISSMGKMTSRLADSGPATSSTCGDRWATAFPPMPMEHLILVGGRHRADAFLAYARESLGRAAIRRTALARKPAAERVTLCYGARRADYLAGVGDFEQLGVDVHLSTDDGSAGHHGFVTEILRRVLEARPAAPAGQSRRIVCCGPWRMMQAVAEVARAASVPCWASLETPMACGIGICFSCVARIRDAAGDWDYRRTCVEGPVFDAERVVW